MRIIRGHICIFLTSVFLFGIVGAANLADNKLNTPEKAVERALLYTGFEERLQDKSTIKDATSIAHKLLIKSDSTPFLWDQIEGREMWVVRFTDVDIRTELKITLGVPPEYRNFTVILDPERGWLARVFSDPVRDRSDLMPKASGEEMKKMINGSRSEIWQSFRDTLVGINFIEALDAAPACFPIIANEITAYYTISSNKYLEGTPIWNIMVRGIPSPIRQKERADGNYKLCGRCTVNSETKELMFFVTMP